MARNPDPKPGRWILPLIVIGMVAFTYLFVNSLEDEVTATPSTSTTSTTLVPIDATEASTTTTAPIDPETQAYLDQVASFASDVEALEVEMVALNESWDAREIEYAVARDTLRDDLNPRITQWGDRVAAATPPADRAEAHAALVAAAEPVVTAAEAVLTGLQAPDTGEARRAALGDFQTAIDAFLDASGAAGA